MNQPNPFQPPKADLADQPETDQLAERGLRLGAALIDGVISMVYAAGIIAGLGTWNYVKQGMTAPFSLLAASAVLGMVCFVLFHGYFLKQNGQTIGKKLVGIRIVTLQGDIPRFGKLIAARYLPLCLAGLIPLVGNLLALVDCLFIFREDRRCIHDLIAGTKVVRC